MRGRKPVPLHLRLVRGNPGKRRLRPEPLRELPKQVEPHDYLLPEAKAEWQRIGLELLRLKLLTILDSHALGACCQSWARWALAERLLAEAGGKLTITTSRGNEVAHPLQRIANDAAADMLKYGSEFGSTPASRARVGGGSEPPSGKFEGLLGG